VLYGVYISYNCDVQILLASITVYSKLVSVLLRDKLLVEKRDSINNANIEGTFKILDNIGLLPERIQVLHHSVVQRSKVHNRTTFSDHVSVFVGDGFPGNKYRAPKMRTLCGLGYLAFIVEFIK
jgi:hypothetical protein